MALSARHSRDLLPTAKSHQAQSTRTSISSESRLSVLPPSTITISHQRAKSIQSRLRELREDLLEGKEKLHAGVSQTVVTPWTHQRDDEILALLDKAWAAAFNASELLRTGSFAGEDSLMMRRGHGEETQKRYPDAGCRPVPTKDVENEVEMSGTSMPDAFGGQRLADQENIPRYPAQSVPARPLHTDRPSPVLQNMSYAQPAQALASGAVLRGGDEQHVTLPAPRHSQEYGLRQYSGWRTSHFPMLQHHQLPLMPPHVSQQQIRRLQWQREQEARQIRRLMLDEVEMWESDFGGVRPGLG